MKSAAFIRFKAESSGVEAGHWQPELRRLRRHLADIGAVVARPRRPSAASATSCNTSPCDDTKAGITSRAARADRPPAAARSPRAGALDRKQPLVPGPPALLDESRACRAEQIGLCLRDEEEHPLARHRHLPRSRRRLLDGDDPPRLELVVVHAGIESRSSAPAGVAISTTCRHCSETEMNALSTVESIGNEKSCVPSSSEPETRKIVSSWPLLGQHQRRRMRRLPSDRRGRPDRLWLRPCGRRRDRGARRRAIRAARAAVDPVRRLSRQQESEKRRNRVALAQWPN